MPAKRLIFGDDDRARTLRGADILATDVQLTLGPRGRTVILERDFGAPQIVNSGVLVAKAVELEDCFENMGAQLLREVAARASEMAGDGTATVLAHAMVREGLRHLASSMNPMDLKRSIVPGGGVALPRTSSVLRGLQGPTLDTTRSCALSSARSRNRCVASSPMQATNRRWCSTASTAAPTRPSATTPRAGTMATCLQWASSTRPRSPGWRCRTQARLQALILTTDCLIAAAPQPGPAAPGLTSGGEF